MITASLEYDRPIRWTRYTGDWVSWTNLYQEDLNNSVLNLSLQDPSTGDEYEGSNMEVTLTVIEGPTGSATFPTCSEDKVVFEFTIPTPTFPIPSGSNYFVEWFDPEEGPVDYYEIDITPKTGDSVLEWIVPFE